MTDTAGYVKLQDKKPEPEPEPVRDPNLVIKFQVQAHSAKCKCVVTASVGLDGNVRLISVHKCTGHEELEKRLADQARTAVLRVLGTWGWADQSVSEKEEKARG
jgi:hypothetical protein